MMKHLFICAFAIALLTGCGGGGSSGGGGTLAACTGSSCTQNGPIQGATLCGVEVGTKRLEGSVTDVHDGDTITLSSGGTVYKIRLDSMDAPELAQPFGSLSQSTLANAVLGKPVRVAYTNGNWGQIIIATMQDQKDVFFAANSPAIGKKNNAAVRPSPRGHRPQGVMQRVLKWLKP